MANFISATLDRTLDGLDSGRSIRAVASSIVRAFGLLGAIGGLGFCIASEQALASGGEKSFLTILNYLLGMTCGVLTIYTNWLLAKRRGDEINTMTDSRYSLLPAVGKVIRYLGEQQALGCALIFLPAGFQSVSGGAAFIQRFSPYLQANEHIPFFAALLGMCVVAIFFLMIAAASIIIPYGVASFLEGFEELVRTNRSIDIACRHAISTGHDLG